MISVDALQGVGSGQNMYMALLQEQPYPCSPVGDLCSTTWPIGIGTTRLVFSMYSSTPSGWRTLN